MAAKVEIEEARASEDHALRIGLLVDGVMANHYVYDFVRWTKNHPRVAVTHLIIHGSPAKKTSGRMTRLARTIMHKGMSAALSKLIYRAVVKIEQWRLAKDGRYSEYFRTYDLSTEVPNTLHIAPVISKSGFVHRFAASDVERVRALGLDLLLRCGEHILRGGILDSSRLGVLSFHHADNRVNRGVPAGFWEVYQRCKTTGFVLQRLTEDLDAGDVLMRGHFGTRHYFLLNKAFLFKKSSHYLKLLVDRIASRGGLPDPAPYFPYSYPLYTYPGARVLSRYFLHSFHDLVAKKFRDFRGVSDRWHIAYAFRGWRDLEYWRGIPVANLPDRYLADPFVAARDGRHYCFAEEWDDRTRRGSIVVYELTPSKAERIGTALAEDFHLSFPYLFEFDGQLFMCPECSESRSIRIYECVEFPTRWRLKTIAMENVEAADSMLFEKDGKWWMLTNIDPSGLGDYCSELFVFWANSPLSDDWRPHPANPVVVDAAYARNAGLLREGTEIFRCSQRQGFDFYGRALQINRIVELTETRFVEERLSIATPTFAPGVVGTHHLHSSSGVTVFDFAMPSRGQKSVH